MKLKTKAEKIKAPCSHDDCKRRAKARHECIVCMKTSPDKVFAVCACGHHQEEILATIKKHTLTAHPVNIVRAVIAQLKGEDVF